MNCFVCHFFGQVDLFFYREPEEAKQQEEEETVPAADYALPPADYGISAGEWSSTIADSQWTADVAQQPIPAANFFPEQGNNIHSDLRVTYLSVIFCTNSLVSFHHSIKKLGGLSVEWSAAPAPAPVPLSATELDGPAPAATGWDI